VRALFDGIPDLLHFCGAGVGRENLLTEEDTHGQSHDGNDGHQDHQGEVRACQRKRWRANGWDKAWHSILL
jgi:hypothetical protein